jgi:hypothetical protein
MAYTTALRNVPAVPQPDGPYVQGDRHPTQQLYDCLKAMQACLESFKKALEQIEPLSVTVAQLPAAASNTNRRYLVTDANSSTFNATAAGGGANIVPVFSNGTVWKIG